MTKSEKSAYTAFVTIAAIHVAAGVAVTYAIAAFAEWDTNPEMWGFWVRLLVAVLSPLVSNVILIASPAMDYARFRVRSLGDESLSWISVNESLPDERDSVTVIGSCGMISARYHGGVWIDSINGMFLDPGAVTHWAKSTREAGK